MKTIKTLSLLLALSLLSLNSFAQDTTQVKLDDEAKVLLSQLKQQLKDIETEEKNKLKDIIAELNTQQAQDSIYSPEDFEAIKMKNAERTAQNIKNRQAVIQNQIEFLKRNGYLAKEMNAVIEEKNDEDSEDDESFTIFKQKIKITSEDDSKKKVRLTTQKDLIIAFGLNNAIPESGGLNDSPFKVGGSRFFEIGFLWSTPISKNNFLHLDYGFSFQFNGLKPEDNQILVENGDQTNLETFEFDLDKSKFRQDNLIFPVHLHFNTKKGNGDYFTRSGFNFGLGAFLGLNLNNIQKLKFEANGDDEKVKFKDDFNTNNFLYGLSAYAGFGDTTLYLTYNINPIFEDNPVDINNVQLGLRFAL
ncbi:hypothetical protein [Flavobacteriaceae bacterium 14752]|uniref:hypothetical protein n=1 Tax=Mesohalobacter salilacus TaxID=2491711 RepID=UPI000F640628|nr:hypothetical protein EIG84_01160 [Flavobacteriaceae bacterium 14752]